MNRANNTILALALMVALCGAASAAELHVGTGQTYSTIQDAVDNATSGDTIIVHAGTYAEKVTVDKERLTLKVHDGDEVTVTVTGTDFWYDDVFVVTADYVNISGFTATGSGYGAGIHINEADHCNVSDNTISDNYYGIWLSASAYDNKVTGNDVHDNEYGIKLDGTDDNEITCNRVHNNSEYGIKLDDADGNEITCNRVHNNKHGIEIHSAEDNEITCNVVRHNSKCGFYLEGGSINNAIENNTIIENGGYDPATDGWQWNFNNQQSDNVSAENNYWGTADQAVIDASIETDSGSVDYEPFNNSPCPCAPVPEVPASSAKELHVGTGQTYSTIQDAVNASLLGDTIIVHAGTYEENVMISTPTLTLQGEDRDVVTVTAADPTGNVFCVNYVDYVSISGFTVTGGNYGINIGSEADHCNISDNNVSNNRNGILLEYSNCYTVIRNNIVKSNAGNFGYGINLQYQQDAHNTITGNDISDNEYGIHMFWSSNNTITCNRVHNNSCGFYLTGGSINNTIENNNIIANGVYNDTSGGYEWQFENRQPSSVN
ncbi:hypothetical protein CW696_04015, partial [ANME-2 cluster archaeon]